jgi:hypothetical protein
VLRGKFGPVGKRRLPIGHAAIEQRRVEAEEPKQIIA